MQDILDLASQLGKAIADSPQGQAVKNSMDQIKGDPDAMRLMRDYETRSEKIARLQHENKPIEVSDKHALAELENQLASNQRVKKLSEAQVEYLDLIRRVNQAIHGELAEVEEPEPDARS